MPCVLTQPTNGKTFETLTDMEQCRNESYKWFDKPTEYHQASKANPSEINQRSSPVCSLTLGQTTQLGHLLEGGKVQCNAPNLERVTPS